MKKELEKIVEDENLMFEFKTMLLQESIVRNLIARYFIKGYPSDEEIEKIKKKIKRVIKYIRDNRDDLIYHLHDEDAYLG